MDKLIDKIVALGVPGLVLLVAISTSGVYGGAAIVAALATLGGPFGMIGGIALLGLLILISKGLTLYGFEAIFKGVVQKLKDNGMSIEEIKVKIRKYPISKSLKLILLDYLDELGSST